MQQLHHSWIAPAAGRSRSRQPLDGQARLWQTSGEMHRYLPTSGGTLRAVRAVLDFAEHPDNWLRPGDGVDLLSCCRPGHEATLGSFKCVYFHAVSWNNTHLRVLCIRQLDAHGVPERGCLPQPAFAWTIASMFGFSGAPSAIADLVSEPAPDWKVTAHEQEGYVLVMQVSANSPASGPAGSEPN